MKLRKNLLKAELIFFVFVGFIAFITFSFSYFKDEKKSANGFSGNVKPLEVIKTSNTVNGQPWDELAINVVSGDNYGRDPYIIVYPNADNTVTVAWLEQESRQIHITQFDKNDSISNEIQCKYLPKKNTNLEGFTKIPATGEMLVGYSKLNPKKDGTEFWIQFIRENGDSIWDRKIFGGKPMTEIGSKCCPGNASTSRIVYNQKTKKIGFFLGHSQKWSDAIHQASYLGFLNLKGERLKPGNTWYISHDFDQRMIVVDSLYYLLSHGDAYPRSLVFSVWTDSEKAQKNNLYYSEYFKIPGEIGDNYTGSRTGGIVPLSDGNFGLVFTSKIGRSRQDICFMKISKTGKVLLTKWLTQNKEIDAEMPKIANRGKNRVLLSWRPNWNSTTFYEIDNMGNILTKKTITKNWEDDKTDIRLCLTHDFVNCPNGDIVWASGDYKNKKLNIYRIKY